MEEIHFPFLSPPPPSFFPAPDHFHHILLSPIDLLETREEEKSMFPFERNCELSFQISNNSTLDPNYSNIIEEDGIVMEYNKGLLLGGMNLPNNCTKSLGKKSSGTGQGCGDSSSGVNNHDKGKKIHRDMERQRRRDMANLHASLRSLLPAEYLRGKRSMSDQLGQAANYIKHMEDNIKELETKRNGLGINTSNPYARQEGSALMAEGLDDVVAIYLRFGGLEVEISAAYRDENIVSRVLHVLLEQGLDVISYVSNNINHRIFLHIQSEVNDVTCIDVSQLQQRLSHLVCSNDF